MKEKQFDHIDNKIREAAEKSIHAFDEQNWARMEQLLDKENNRRSPLLWYLIPALLCIVAGGYLFFNTEIIHIKSEINPHQLNTGKQNINTYHQEQGAIQLSVNKTSYTNNNNQLVPASSIMNQSAPDQIKERIFSANKINHYTNGRTKIHVVVNEPAVSEVNILEIKKENTDSATDQLISKVIKNDTPIIIKQQNGKSVIAQNTFTEKPDSGKSIHDIGRKKSRFYFSVSAGADASSVKFFSFNNSTVLAKYDIAAGYQLNKKISLQTGFNISRKRYIAGPGDYNPKAGSYWSTVEIKKVDANCLVFEIPLSVRFNIAEKKSAIFFATTGFSSFIMKKEDYDYYYTRNSTGYESYHSYTGNKNFFSIWTLSVGMDKKLSPAFSLLAEPSVSIPLAGIGDGRVKLFSAGVQLGIKYQPFKKK